MISTEQKEQLKDFVVEFAEDFPLEVLEHADYELPYNIVAGVFYGSVVQGTFKRWSDIDMAIITDSVRCDCEQPTKLIEQIKRDWLTRRLYQTTNINRLVQITLGHVSVLRPQANKAWSNGLPWGIGFLVSDHDTEFILRTKADIRTRFRSVIRDGVNWGS